MQSLGRPAWKFAFVLVHDIDIAQEIVQAAFARAWASANTPSAEADFRRYLYRTIMNLVRDYGRQRARAAMLPATPAAATNPLDIVDRRAGDDALRAALRALTVRERQAVYLRYFEDQSFAETARIMRTPQVTVRVIVHRALGKLRRELGSRTVPNQVAM